MFFYLGAKFGPKLLNSAADDQREGFLPDDKLASEVKKILSDDNHHYQFQEALQSKKPIDKWTKDVKKVDSFDEKNILSAKELKQVFPKQNSKTKKVENKKTVSSGKMNVKLGEAKVIQLISPVEDSAIITSVNTKKTAKDVITLDEDVPAKFSLQLGSYAEQKKAASERKKWVKRGYATRVMKTKVEGKGNWYRLRLGYYTDLKSVQQAQKKVMKKYGQFARVISLVK
jgi:cell division protein FtsN